MLSIPRQLAWLRFRVPRAEFPAAIAGLTVPVCRSLWVLVLELSGTFPPCYYFACVPDDRRKDRTNVAPKKKKFAPEPLEEGINASVTKRGHWEHKVTEHEKFISLSFSLLTET